MFRYFATIQVPQPNGEYEVFMTPVDFLTSMSFQIDLVNSSIKLRKNHPFLFIGMTPGMKQPDGNCNWLIHTYNRQLINNIFPPTITIQNQNFNISLAFLTFKLLLTLI